MGKGYIRLHRQIMECSIWETGEQYDKRSAWVELILLANHKDKKVIFNNEIITVKRGQHLTSIRKLAERWGWSRGKVDRFLRLLESDSMVDTKRATNNILINIVNYDIYQYVEDEQRTTDEPRTDHERATDEPQTDINNNDINEINNKRKDISKDISKRKVDEYYEDVDVNNAFKDYVRMRKLIKHPMTDEAIKRAKAKLEKLSNGNKELAIAILNQSVDHSWQGLFELKEEKGVTNAKQHNTTEFTEEELRERGFWDDFM